MSVRRGIGLTVLVLIASLSGGVAAFGQSVAPYPGSTLTFEVNLTEKDFLPAIKQFLPIVPGIVHEQMKTGEGKADGQPAHPQVDFEQLTKDLTDAISGLKRVSVAGYELKSASTDKLLQFYADRFGLNTGWTATLKVNDQKGSVRLYTKPDLAGVFALVVQPDSYFVLRTEGPVDLAQLMRIAREVMPMVMTMRTTSEECSVPSTGEQPAQGESGCSESTPQADESALESK